MRKALRPHNASRRKQRPAGRWRHGSMTMAGCCSRHIGSIAKAISEEQVIMPAAEWLVDNFHIVEEQIREIHEDFPHGYYCQLPKLAEGPLEGYPRVFGIAWAFVAHTDSRFDFDMLCRFVRAYQRVQPLTIGELWAVAITLRIVLVENLRRSAQCIVTSRAERQEANSIADRLLGSRQPFGRTSRCCPSPFHRHAFADSICSATCSTLARSGSGGDARTSVAG